MNHKFIFCLDKGTIQDKLTCIANELHTNNFNFEYSFKSKSLADAVYQVYLSNRSGITDEQFKDVIKIYNNLVSKVSFEDIKKYGILAFSCNYDLEEK